MQKVARGEILPPNIILMHCIVSRKSSSENEIKEAIRASRARIFHLIGENFIFFCFFFPGFSISRNFLSSRLLYKNIHIFSRSAGDKRENGKKKKKKKNKSFGVIRCVMNHKFSGGFIFSSTVMVY